MQALGTTTTTTTRQYSSSVYPTHPRDSQLLFRVPANEVTFFDQILVVSSSLFIVGSVFWLPLSVLWSWRKWKAISDPRRKVIYAMLALATATVVYRAPYGSPRIGQWCKFRQWRLWKAWMRYVAMEIIIANPKTTTTTTTSSSSSAAAAQRGSNPHRSKTVDDTHIERTNSPAKQSVILAFVPHGIFPFGIALGALPDIMNNSFGSFRPVVAPATDLFPFVRTFLKWLRAILATRTAVSEALSQGERIGLIPGGIEEIFEGYPKPGTRPDEEYIVVHQGFLRLAMEHQVPIVPIFCFGSSRIMKRLQVPWLDQLSRLLRISICLFFGRWGLPIPYRQRMTYIIGDTIYPPPMTSTSTQPAITELYEQFCNELIRIFNRHKEAYGWGHKTLKVVSR